MSRLTRFCGALVATLLAVAPLTSPALAQVPRDVVVVGMEAEPPGLDPGQALGLHTLRVTAEIFETLVATRPDSTEVIPGLAESWTTSPDGMIWTFKLRRGVRFHDGTPLDAAAVKFTFDRVIDPTHPHAKSGKWSFVTGYLSSVKSVEVLDPQTVQLHLKYPTGSLPALLALPNCAIVSPTAFTKAPADFDTKPVGSGRYKFESWERGSRLVLRRNDDYWGVKGKPQALVYRGIPEANTRVSELLTGGVDLILPIPPDFVERLEKTSGVTVHKATGLTVWYAGFNVEKKPFTDRRVRQAFNYAVNKDAIVRDILKGTGIPAVGPLLPGTWAFEPNVHKYPYDPAVARKLLAEAGYPNGLEVDFWVPESGSGMQAPVEMSTVIQANLAAAGVKAPLKTFEWGSYLGKVRSDAPAMFALSWFLKSEDPDLSMYPLFFSKNQPLPNRSNYNNPEVDQLLVQARQLTDRAKRAELYRKAQRLIVEDAPWLFVDHEVQVVATRANVKGFHLHPSGFDLRVENVTKE
jgi:peptide/nickel transport system substrate-binding protein